MKGFQIFFNSLFFYLFYCCTFFFSFFFHNLHKIAIHDQFILACSNNNLEKFNPTNLELVKKLFKKVDKQTQEEGLGFASIYHQSEIMKWLLIDGKVNPNIVNANSDPLILQLSEKGNIELIQLYLEKGGNLHSVNEESGNNALHMSAFHDQMETTKFLISHGIDFKLKNAENSTAYDYAKENELVEMSLFLHSVSKK